jgi:hypothetical protein
MAGASQSPVFLVFLLLGLWVAAFALLGRYWRRSKAGQEWREFNARLGPTIRRRAASIQWLSVIVMGLAVMVVAARVRHIFHPDENPGDASAVAVALIVVSSYIIALFPARLLANIIWRLMPSMKNASRAARVGLELVTFERAIRLLAIQAAVVIPICIAQIYLGAVMP